MIHDDSIKLLDILLQRFCHLHELVVANLDVPFVFRVSIHGKQIIEADCRSAKVSLSLNLEPVHLGAHLYLYVGRLHHSLELEFSAHRPFKDIRTLMLIREFEKSQK